MLLHCKRIAELHKPIAFLFICKFLQEGQPSLAEPPSHGQAVITHRGMCFYSTSNGAGTTPHHTTPLLWQRFSKNVKKGLVSLFCISENSLWCTLRLPDLLPPLLFYSIFNHPTFLFVIIINTFNVFLTRNRVRLPTSGNQQCGAVPIHFSSDTTAIQLPPFHSYAEKASTVSYRTSLWSTQICITVYTSTRNIPTHIHKSYYPVEKSSV